MTTIADDNQNYSRAMTAEDIQACADINFLVQQLQVHEERCVVIATMLEFPDPRQADGDWFGRARGALIAFRLAARRIDGRLKWLRREVAERIAAERRAAVTSTGDPSLGSVHPRE